MPVSFAEKMRAFFVFIGLLGTGLLIAQRTEEFVQQERGDTLFVETVHYDAKQRITRVHYFRKLKSQHDWKKEDIFMQGLDYFHETDSVRLVSYGADGNRTGARTVSGAEWSNTQQPATTFSSRTEAVQGSSEKIFTAAFSGRSGTERTHRFPLGNGTAQDQFIRVRDTTAVLQFAKTEFLLASRSDAELEVTFPLLPGRHTHEFYLEQGAEISERVFVITTGYDLLDQDFGVSKAEVQTIELPFGRSIFLEVLGREKVVQVDDNPGITIYEAVPEIPSTVLPLGEHWLTLRDLGSKAVRHTRVVVKK